MIEPEQYNEFGEIVKVEPVRTFERRMTAHDTHRIHETKDLFDGDCSYCQQAAKKIRSYWAEQEKIE